MTPIDKDRMERFAERVEERCRALGGVTGPPNTIALLEAVFSLLTDELERLELGKLDVQVNVRARRGPV